ncbi:MAG: hypothetical protein F9B45_26810 [Phycisphaera sp. RhM]|nr:hypothetical protein [Phycisphaera sp. RhM]
MSVDERSLAAPPASCVAPGAAAPCDAAPCDAAPCDAAPCDAAPCDAAPCGAAPCDAEGALAVTGLGITAINSPAASISSRGKFTVDADSGERSPPAESVIATLTCPSFRRMIGRRLCSSTNLLPSLMNKSSSSRMS